MHNAIVNEALPGLFRELCGVEVVEYDSLLTGAVYRVKTLADDVPMCGNAAIWCDVLQPTSASVLAVYDHNFYAGTPVITVNSLGQGQVVYVGTFGDSALVQDVTDLAAKLAGVRRGLATPAGVEALVRRKGNDQSLLFLLNHTDAVQSVELEQPHRDLLSGEVLLGQVLLSPKQVMVLTST